MKLWNSIYLKWLIISALITGTCVYASFYITRQWAETERRHFRGPHRHHVEIIKNLVKSGKMSIDEAYAVVETGAHKETPDVSYLMDGKGAILNSNLHGRRSPEPVFVERVQIADDRYIEYHLRHPGGRPRRPPPGIMKIGTIATGTSIVVGLGLSLIFFSFYIRFKSREAEEVISKLKAGDLKARFKIDPHQENASLILRFNEMADQVEQLVNNLRHTEESRKKMLQELAHDLRTPVASLKNFQEIIYEKDHLLEKEKKKQIQTLAIKEVTYLERLVEDLLFLSGVNDPRYSANFKEVFLNDLIQEEMETFEGKGIKISFTCVEAIYVRGDTHLLKRLLKNALSNALRFAKSEVKIIAHKLPSGALLQVIDDGPGIKDLDLSSFGEKKFSRSLTDDENAFISVGLGSVIMKKIVSIHDGDMLIQNLHPGFKIAFTLRS